MSTYLRCKHNRISTPPGEVGIVSEDQLSEAVGLEQRISQGRGIIIIESQGKATKRPYCNRKLTLKPHASVAGYISKISDNRKAYHFDPRSNS